MKSGSFASLCLQKAVSSEVETLHRISISKHVLLVTGLSKRFFDFDHETPSSSAFPAVRRRIPSASYSSALHLYKLLIETEAEKATILIAASSVQS